MTSENAKKSTTRWGLITVFALVGVGVVVTLGLIEAWVYSRFDEWPIRGLVGDMFGVGNAVFSALAFVGVIIAICLQNKELGLQRQELVLTRTEVKGQREQLQAQAETLKKQTLENTLFQLLRLHQEILQAVRFSRGQGIETRGREAIRDLAGKFRDECNVSEHKGLKGLKGLEDECLRDAYNEFHLKFQSSIGHYFRNLYQILKFINGGQAEEEDKKLYGRLVRAQLSSDELFLLFYNCLSEVGVKKFKPLVEKFAMLHHVPRELLILPKHIELYDPLAFGEAE